jgi:predicted phage terminase large subunit-like protein
MKDSNVIVNKIKQILQQKDEFLINKARTDFKTFAKLITKNIDKFNIVKLNQDWIDVVIEDFTELINSQDIHRAIYNIPPRTGKTTLLTTIGSCFLIGMHKNLKIGIINANNEKLQEINKDIKDIINSDIYRKIFNIKDLASKNAVRLMRLNNGSSIVFKVSGSNVIGSGYHFLFFDDYLNPNHERSQARKEQAMINLSSFLSRKEYKPKSKIIIIEQRIGMLDTTAICKKNWDNANIPYFHISLPYYFEEEMLIRNKLFKQGFYLDIKFNAQDKKEIEGERGLEAFRTQYQQNPTALKGTYIKEEYIMKYNGTRYQEIIFKEIFMTCDLAVKTGEKNDYTVVVLFGIMPNGRLFVIDILRGKWDTDRTKQIVNFWFSWQNRIKHVGSPVIHIEDAAGGHDLANHLKMYYKIPVKLITRTKDLETRIEAVMGFVESKTLWMPYNLTHFNKPDLMNDVYHEITSFVRLENKRDRRTGHDDVLSCIIDGLQYYKDKYYKVHMEYVGMNVNTDK